MIWAILWRKLLTSIHLMLVVKSNELFGNFCVEDDNYSEIRYICAAYR